ncbi:hypothetical protein F4777DRAFT_595395 [Nemania sp. FL0916]|nr:hypothetical protein F4777DRAFT_595395 [Nemania sp. FL0916]
MDATTIFDAHKFHPPMSPVSPAPPPPPPPPSRGPRPDTPSPAPADPASGHEPPEHYRLMPKGEWLQFCRGIGILKDDESEQVVRATSRVWPPSAFKDGLYSDVLFQRTKFTYYYHAIAVIAWLLLLTQLALSAILTALGATSRSNGTPITIIAAISTAVSGILALLHNSGLPDRYRWDRNEFCKIEDHMRAIVDTGLVPANHSTNDVLAQCFEMYAAALQTVEKNTPNMYTPNLPTTSTTTGSNPPITAPEKVRFSTQHLDSANRQSFKAL